MTEPLLSGINHVAFASRNLDKTVRFYADIFDLQPSEKSAMCCSSSRTRHSST